VNKNQVNTNDKSLEFWTSTGLDSHRHGIIANAIDDVLRIAYTARPTAITSMRTAQGSIIGMIDIPI